MRHQKFYFWRSRDKKRNQNQKKFIREAKKNLFRFSVKEYKSLEITCMCMAEGTKNTPEVLKADPGTLISG